MVGDALLIGLSEAVPSCAVLLRLDCPVSGRGVDPRRPPIVWEAWTDEGWVGCDLDSDDTGGLNKPGDVIVHVPDNHQTSVIARRSVAGWLRCRLIEASRRCQPTYRVPDGARDRGAHHRWHRADGERRGGARRDPGPFGRYAGPAVCPAAPPGRRLGRAADADRAGRRGGADLDARCRTSRLSGPNDRHFRIDAYAGEIQFGPALRTVGGGLQSHGAIPPTGAVLRLESYRTGGGQAGNVARGQVRVLKTSIPYVSRVENRSPAIGGAEAETLDDAKARGPLLLRSRGRAVTARGLRGAGPRRRS